MFRFFEQLIDPFGPYDDRAVPPKRLWPFMMMYLQPLRPLLFWITLVTSLVALSEIGLIYYVGRVVDMLVATTPALVFREHGVELVLIALFILFLRPIMGGIDSFLLNQALMTNLTTIVRWRSHRHVLKQSVGWFENDFAGRIANRMMQTAPAAGEAVFQVFDALVFATIYLIGAMVLLAEIDLRLGIPMVVWFAFYLWLTGWVIPRIGIASKEFSDARSTITGRIVDSYSNIQSVKLFAHNNIEEQYAKEAIQVARHKFARQMRYITIMDIGLNLLNGALVVAVIGWSIQLWRTGDTSIGTVAAAATLTLRLSAMTGWIMWALSSFFQNLGVISEGMETIAQDIELVDDPNAYELVMDKGAISFKDIRHHYGKAQGGLAGVSAQIKGGEKIGLIGRSGAGKSSLVNLMLRFHELESGDVLIDGQSIRSVSQNSLRRQIGMVTQDSALMHRSVMDNIRYGRPEASEAEIFAAARQAEAHEFILGLSDPAGRTGYDAHVGERGVKLSGGQRQRIALARVILKNAPILILDEATSALDSEVEAEIQETLYGVMAGKTVIAIAHRLSTIARMDRIMVMDAGAIAEEGTHQELLALNGLYAGFWRRQSGGFIGIDDASA